VVLVGGWELLQLEEGQQRAEQGSRALLVCEAQPEQDGGISGRQRWGGGGRTVSSEDYSLDIGARTHSTGILNSQCSLAPKLANEMRQRAGWIQIKSRVKWRNNELLILTEPE
jgi:hypothetical protein